jgi:protoporphyrinogen oxidase
MDLPAKDGLKTAIIAGAGPAGLTAAYELLTRAGIRPIVLEKSAYIGGICRTINFKGNLIDIGGHRFFSKSERVMNWWLRLMPLEPGTGATKIRYHGMEATLGSDVVQEDGGVGKCDRVMLLRPRKSRVYFLRKLFEYPIRANRETVMQLGLLRTVRIGLSYMKSVVMPFKNEETLEQFFINRFGRQLYYTFFKSYTEKIWGVPCNRISAEWGAQRIKGLSLWNSLLHAFRILFNRRPNRDLAQKDTETSLIDRFLYPKYGPGQLWEEAARRIREMGGSILMCHRVDDIQTEGRRIRAVRATDLATGRSETFPVDYFFSTMPVRELVQNLNPPAPHNVREVAAGLVYRDFIVVGLLVSRLKLKESSKNGQNLIRDNWIYIQEPDVLVGRLQIFNNWSPHMVADPNTVWLGLEYFCNDSDPLWTKADADLIRLGVEELARIDIIESGDVLDGTVIRMEKTYPAYFGAYDRFGEIRQYVDGLENLFLLGRNGMHRYNNQDHSMLTAMIAVDNIVAGETDKTNLWSVNTESEYHEER